MSTGRRLIVNADDFGRSHGINRGVFAAFASGILTSASLMVRWPAARDAVAYARAAPALSLGLHIDLGEWRFVDDSWQAVYEVVDMNDPDAVRDEVWRQVERLDQLYGAYPTHLDSHQHVHRTEPVRAVVLEVAQQLDIPVREEHPRVAYEGGFHGQTGQGEQLPDAISADALTKLILALPPGIAELSCHPALQDESGSSYAEERDLEVEVLCDPAVRAALDRSRVKLVSFGQVNAGAACRARRTRR